MKKSIPFLKFFTLKPRQIFPCWHSKYLMPAILTLLLMFSIKGMAQLTGTVPVQTPSGGFAVEGDAYANTPTAGIGDWFANYSTYPGTGGALFNLDGSIIDPNMSYFLQDGWRGGPVDLTVFATDNKINQNPNDYYWKRGDAPAKNEIENVGVHFTYGSAALGGNPNDLWCLFAGDRMVTNGDSYLDFEFLQKPLTMVVTGQDSQGYDNGKFVSQGLDGGRTVGDLLVTIEFHNGGVAATIVIQRWEFVGGTYKYVVYPNSNFVGSIYATNNTVLTNVPFDAFGYNYYVVNQWAEGAINLTKVLNLGQNPCYNISTVFVRTRTSGESGTSQLKDFPGGPIQLNLNLSKLTVHCPTPVILPSCSSTQDIETAFSNWRSSFSNSGGVEPVMEKFEDLLGNPVNIYDILPPDRCGGTVELKYFATDYCGITKNCTSSFTILPDHDAPVFLNIPQEVTVSCKEEVPSMTELGWSDNCDGQGMVLGQDESDGKSCPETITRSWYYMDACGNEAFASQKIIVHDKVAPVIHAPEDYSVCEELLPEYLEATWTDNCSEGGTLIAYGVPYSSDECSTTMAYTFTVEDACGNVATEVTYVTRKTEVTHCETAYAKLDDENTVCFLEDGFNRWGWTNMIAEEGSYTLPIYQGAAQCDITKGKYVGNVYVTYSDGTVTVEYDVMDGYFMSEAHVYIGCDKYPVFKKKPTVAPGQYTFNASSLDHINHLTVTFDVSDYDGPFYLIAHAVTCEYICTCYDLPEGGLTAEPYYMNVNLNCVEKAASVADTTPSEPTKLKIYPVPFEDSIDVQYRFDYMTDVTIQVYNLLGVLIYETTDSKYVKSKDGVKHIDLPRTSAQTLVVKIITNKEELSKLIISK